MHYLSACFAFASFALAAMCAYVLTIEANTAMDVLAVFGILTGIGHTYAALRIASH